MIPTKYIADKIHVNFECSSSASRCSNFQTSVNWKHDFSSTKQDRSQSCHHNASDCSGKGKFILHTSQSFDCLNSHKDEGGQFSRWEKNNSSDRWHSIWIVSQKWAVRQKEIQLTLSGYNPLFFSTVMINSEKPTYGSLRPFEKEEGEALVGGTVKLRTSLWNL